MAAPSSFQTIVELTPPWPPSPIADRAFSESDTTRGRPLPWRFSSSAKFGTMYHFALCISLPGCPPNGNDRA